jgi:hypothetical protein
MKNFSLFLTLIFTFSICAKEKPEAKTQNNEGYTINEDNVIYERYPYQIKAK